MRTSSSVSPLVLHVAWRDMTHTDIVAGLADPYHLQSLTVLDYLLHAGSENVVVYFKDNIYIIKTLKEFQFVDEEGKDQGANVRQKAKDITNLLQDESRLRHERRDRDRKSVV